MCAVLAAVSLAWIIRDLDTVDPASDLWWWWGNIPMYGHGMAVSSVNELVLLLIYVVVGSVAVRSSAAAGALVSAALLTLVLRLPSLWNLHSDWMNDSGVPDGLLTKAKLTVWAGVLLSAALLFVVGAGRRPVPPGQPGQPGHPGQDGFPSPNRPLGWSTPPTRPRPGAAIVSALALLSMGAVTVAWQIYYLDKYSWGDYKLLFTGKRTLATVLASPIMWQAWAIALLTLVAAFAVLRQATFSRQLGMVMAGLLLAEGVMDVSVYVKVNYFEHFADLPTVGKLTVLTGCFLLLIGLIVLPVLARRGLPAGGPPEPAGGWPPGPAFPPPHGGTAPGGAYGPPDGGPGYPPWQQPGGYRPDPYQPPAGYQPSDGGQQAPPPPNAPPPPPPPAP